jgi:hypothetical protein
VRWRQAGHPAADSAHWFRDRQRDADDGVDARVDVDVDRVGDRDVHGDRDRHDDGVRIRLARDERVGVGFGEAVGQRCAEEDPRQEVKVLAPEWAAWIGENLASAAPRAEIVEGLAAGGVPRDEALARVLEIEHATAALRARLRGRELHARLMRELARDKEIERRKKPPAAEFFSRYWANAEPVVFTDATKGWRLWSPADMKRLVGDVTVKVARGRLRKRFTKTTVARFVDDVVRAKKPADLYLVANSFAMDEPGMEPLLRRIRIDPTYFDLKATAKNQVALWLGPKGTVTPLHHDTTNVFFHQIHGRKEFTLVSPFSGDVLDKPNGYYGNPRSKRRGQRIVLEPGDALFLPAGWWHEVRALDASISLSLLAFRKPNSFEWYRPGFSGDGSIRGDS